MKELRDYVNEFNRKSRHVKVYITEHDGVVFCVDVRFPATQYKCRKQDFRTLKAAIGLVSGDTMTIVTDTAAFNSGIITMAIATCNHGYSPRLVRKTIRYFTDSLLPKLKK